MGETFKMKLDRIKKKAKTDKTVHALYLEIDGLYDVGWAKLDELRRKPIADFRGSGKKVFASSSPAASRRTTYRPGV